VSTPLSSLPAVDRSALPASVRNGTEQERKTYEAALGFEQVLLGELVEQIVPEGSALANGPYAGAVRDAFAEGLVASGGIGLGAQLFETMQRTRS
jgi:hypothetical protein